MTRLLGVLVTTLLAWCGVTQPVQALVPTPVATYAYDACRHVAVPTCITTERGPLAEPYRDIAKSGVGYWLDGALVRSARTATSIADTYDALAPLAQAARDAGAKPKQVHDERAALSALGESPVAAKSVDELAVIGFRSNTSHIFRNATGHLAEDTVENCALIKSALDPANLRETVELKDVVTLRKYFRDLPDGT